MQLRNYLAAARQFAINWHAAGLNGPADYLSPDAQVPAGVCAPVFGSPADYLTHLSLPFYAAVPHRWFDRDTRHSGKSSRPQRAGRGDELL